MSLDLALVLGLLGGAAFSAWLLRGLLKVRRIVMALQDGIGSGEDEALFHEAVDHLRAQHPIYFFHIGVAAFFGLMGTIGGHFEVTGAAAVMALFPWFTSTAYSVFLERRLSGLRLVESDPNRAMALAEKLESIHISRLGQTRQATIKDQAQRFLRPAKRGQLALLEGNTEGAVSERTGGALSTVKETGHSGPRDDGR